MLRDFIPFLRSEEAPPEQGIIFVPRDIRDEDGLTRASRRRIARAQAKPPTPTLQKASLTKLSEADEKALRKQVSDVTGEAPDRVDLDAPLVGSGALQRRQERRLQRDRVNNRQRGQRAFRRQSRASETFAETRDAQRRVLAGEAGSPAMRQNVQQHYATMELLKDRMLSREELRSKRRVRHEERRAALGQTPDGRPA